MMENLPMRGSREMRAKDGDQGSGIERLQGGREGVLGREIDQNFDIERFVAWGALNGGLFLELLEVGALDDAGAERQADLFIFGGQRGVGIPGGRADPLTAVAHEPVDVVLAFADIKGSLEVSVAARGVFYGRHADALGEVQGRLFLVGGGDAEHDGEHVLGARQFLQGDADLITRVEPQIETQGGFHLGDRAGQILTLFARLEHREIGVEHIDIGRGSGGQNGRLRGEPKTNSGQGEREPQHDRALSRAPGM